MIRSFLNVFLPEDEYKRLRILYFIAETAFLMGGLLFVGSVLNTYWLKLTLEPMEVTLLLVMIPMLMTGFAYCRYIFSGIEHTKVSSKQDYKKERRVSAKRAIGAGLTFFIIIFILQGIPTNYNEGIDLIALPIVFAFMHFIFDIISLKRSAKKNKELNE